MYLPFERSPANQTTLFIRTSSDPTAVQQQLHRAIRDIEPGALISDPGSLATVASESVAIPRLLLALLGVFAGVAVALASIGIYGVTAYSVQQRSKEIGMRIALGAQRADVYALIMRRGSLLWLIGAVVGLGGAFAGSRLLSSMLYSTSTVDPLVIAAAPMVLLVVTLGACYVPARRAASVDPKTTLSE
jgi:putative ABC transport system permease protein